MPKTRAHTPMGNARRAAQPRQPFRGRAQRQTLTPLDTVACGLVAGAVGTLAMDALWFARYRRDGGESGFAAWELSSGLCSWEDAPAPAQVGKRLVEGLFERELPPQRASRDRLSPLAGTSSATQELSRTALSLRQPPARLLATISLSIPESAASLNVSPSRIATVRAVLLSCPPVMIPSGSGTIAPS